MRYFLQMLSMCDWNVNLLSKNTPGSFSQEPLLICSFSVMILGFTLDLQIKWHLSGLVFIWLSLNQLKSVFEAFWIYITKYHHHPHSYQNGKGHCSHPIKIGKEENFQKVLFLISLIYRCFLAFDEQENRKFKWPTNILFKVLIRRDFKSILVTLTTIPLSVSNFSFKV